MIPKHMSEQGAKGIAGRRSNDLVGLLRTPAGEQARRDADGVLVAVLGSEEALAGRLYGALEHEWECYPERDELNRPIRCGHHPGSHWEADEDRCEETWITAKTCAELIFRQGVAK